MAIRVIERYKSINATCDTTFFERGDCEVKGIRDQLLKKCVILMLFWIVHLLKPIKKFCKQLQLRGFQLLCANYDFKTSNIENHE